MPEISKSDIVAFNKGYGEALRNDGMLEDDLASFAQFVKDHPERFPILGLIEKP